MKDYGKRVLNYIKWLIRDMNQKCERFKILVLTGRVCAVAIRIIAVLSMTRPWPALFLQRVWMARGRMEASLRPVTAAAASGVGALPVTSPTPPLRLHHFQPIVSDRSVCPASAGLRMTLWTSRTLAVCCLMSPFLASARSATISYCQFIITFNVMECRRKKFLLSLTLSQLQYKQSFNRFLS